ncbi:MAG: T9SS type A sorting domain-containing protein [Syntrophomonadaceae bacterium]
MKKVFTKIVLIALIILSSNSLKANPIGAEFFSEIVFDSTGWKLEMHLTMAAFQQGDSISLKGWYLVSGTDTAYFKDWQYLKAPERHGSAENTNFLVLTKDSLKGSLNLTINGGRISLHSPDGHKYDEFSYSTLKLGQSLCVLYDGSCYLDNSPTIGSQNDSEGATGVIKGFVKDLADKPAAKYGFLVYSSHGESYTTDATGHFEFNWLSRSYTFGLPYNGERNLTVSLQPGDTLNLEFKLNFLVDVEKKATPEVREYALEQNYPNPFNPATSISYSLARAGVVNIKVFNLLGNEIATLVNNYQNAGSYKVSFDASTLPSGVYIYTIQSGGFRNAKKMTVLK